MRKANFLCYKLPIMATSSILVALKYQIEEREYTHGLKNL